MQAIFKMADGRHFEDCWVTISQWKIVRYWTRWQPCNQKLKFKKFKMAAATYLENRFLGHNSSTECPISAKFYVRKQNGMPTKATWHKLQIFKIQDCAQTPFWKLLNRHISVNKNLAIANRSHVSCTHNTLRASIGINITPWPWNLGLLKVTGNGTIE